jgi:hypothetical protein
MSRYPAHRVVLAQPVVVRPDHTPSRVPPTPTVEPATGNRPELRIDPNDRDAIARRLLRAAGVI